MQCACVCYFTVLQSAVQHKVGTSKNVKSVLQVDRKAAAVKEAVIHQCRPEEGYACTRSMTGETAGLGLGRRHARRLGLSMRARKWKRGEFMSTCVLPSHAPAGGSCNLHSRTSRSYF